MVDTPHIKLRWQNLIHKKCPACDTRLESTSNGYECAARQKDECPGRFFITKRRFAEILTNPDHAAIKFMNRHERAILDDALRDLGIENPDQFWRAPVKNDRIEPDASSSDN